MNLTKHLPLLAFTAMTAFAMRAQSGVVPATQTFPAASAAAKVKSYREWKHELVVDAQSKVAQVKAKIDAKKSSRTINPGSDPNLVRPMTLEATVREIPIEKLEKEMREEQYDLDVANDLSVTDYFVGYLTKVPNKKAAFKEVAGKLSPDEVAELMTAYANSVFGAHAADLPTSASNLTKDPVK